MRVFVTGGTGFIGSRLVAALLERGDQPVVLTRSAKRAEPLGDVVEVVEGDATEAGSWQHAVSGCGAVVNLLGEPIDRKRWNAQFRQRLHDVRVEGTRYVVEAIGAAEERPSVLVSASGIDYYPLLEPHELDADDEFKESDPSGETFLSRMCRNWEEEARAAEKHGVRVVLMRTGFVVGRGGPLDKMITQFKWFVGGRIASGEQWTSWIHVDDVVRAYLYAIDTPSLTGPVNLVAPHNARNRELARALGKAMGRPARFPVPGFAVKAAIGELGEYLLGGRRAVPSALRESGFEFRYPDVDDAMNAAVGR